MADPMDKAVELAEKLAKAMSQLIEQQGPAAWDLALGATRLNAGVNLALHAAGAVVFGVLAVKAHRLIQPKVQPALDNYNPAPVFAYCGTVAPALIATIVCALHAAKPEWWIALLDPRAAIALRIIGVK